MSSLVLVFLQVQNPILDLLGAALVPELGPDIAAGAAGHVQLILVGIAAVGAGRCHSLHPFGAVALVLLSMKMNMETNISPLQPSYSPKYFIMFGAGCQ